MAHIVILFYDYLLTLNDEKQLIWSIKRFTVANVIFYLNRYVTLLGYIPILLGRSLSSERQNVGFILCSIRILALLICLTDVNILTLAHRFIVTVGLPVATPFSSIINI